MAGINFIIDHIKNEANENVQAILKEANEYSSSVVGDAKRMAEEEVNAINKKCEQELKSIADRTVSSSELKKKQYELESKQEIIIETIEKAKNKLINLSDSEYVEFIKKVFNKNIPTKDCEIIFNAKDLQRVPKQVIDELIQKAKQNGSNMVLSSKNANIKSGFVLNFGDIEGNCSFESLIDRNIDELIDEVNKILFS